MLDALNNWSVCVYDTKSLCTVAWKTLVISLSIDTSCLIPKIYIQQSYIINASWINNGMCITVATNSSFHIATSG